MSRGRRALFVVVLAVASAVVPAIGQAAPGRGTWLAGDLHVHTIWGHDTCVTPTERWDDSKADPNARLSCDEPWTWAWSPGDRLADAESRGLDFVAITDHNNVMSLRDPGYTAYRGPVLKIPGYENSMAGHVQMLGAPACYANDGPVSVPIVECDKLVTDRSPAGMQRLADALRANGGVFQVNHPSDHNWDSAYGHSIVPDTVEVWNIGPWAFQRPLPAANDNDFSLDWWDGFLKAGHHVGATGGSDSHWRATSSNQGIGEPTTWVLARDRSVAAVLDGLRHGRTTVSMEPPGRLGPRLYFEADAKRSGRFDAVPGDTVRPGATFRVRADNVVPGSILRIVTDRGVSERTYTGTVTFTSAARRFVRVELRLPDAQDARTAACDPVVRQFEQRSGQETTFCRDRLAMEALSSPIYVGR